MASTGASAFLVPSCYTGSAPGADAQIPGNRSEVSGTGYVWPLHLNVSEILTVSEMVKLPQWWRTALLSDGLFVEGISIVCEKCEISSTLGSSFNHVIFCISAREHEFAFMPPCCRASSDGGTACFCLNLSTSVMIDDSSCSYKTRQHNIQAPREKYNIHKASSTGYEQSSITFLGRAKWHWCYQVKCWWLQMPACVRAGWIVSKEVSCKVL